MRSMLTSRLELDSFDPRGLLIPPNPLLHSLTVHDIADGDDWIQELLIDAPADPEPRSTLPEGLSPLESPSDLIPRFPNLRFLSLHHTSLLALPTLPLSSLTHLDLSHNLLNSIPDALSECHNLVSLNLSNNLITSVRGAQAALGNIHTINLARNRIDCLVGLDRVLGLRRIDVRGNALAEAGEVGRLAVLPHVTAVWAAENPLTQDEDWRAEVAASFAAEDHKVVLDDTPLAWSEQRRVDAILAKRGRARRERTEEQTGSPERQDSAPASPDPSSPPNASATASPAPSAPNPLIPTPAGRVVASPAPTPKSAHRKRPRRRVVNLDEDTATPTKAREGKGHKRTESRVNGD